MAVNKPSQILQLTPASEIVFEGPFDDVVTSYLELRNPSDEKVCFKVKTTAPKRYCVRPNSGIVEPTGKVKIAIMLQPIEQDNQAERSKHKFMVQSTIIRNETLNLDTVWSNAAQEAIMDSKLRCVFQSPTSSAKVEEPAPTSTSTISTNSPDVVASAVEAAKSSTNASSAKIQTSSTSLPNSTNQQHVELINNANTTEKQKHPIADDGKSFPQGGNLQQASSSPTSSTSAFTAPTERTSTKTWESNISSRNLRKSNVHDQSVASTQNLTTSFLQQSEDYKVVIVSLVMLIIGVILGKYII